MDPNPVLRRLGMSDRDRAVVVHADDIGMCQASLDGLEALFAAGTVTSGSVMVPCPWFRAAARFAREHPGADLGVHLTLTSEWPTYRWAPLSTVDPASGLLDGEGCFPQTAHGVQTTAQPAAAEREMEAQIVRAVGAGMRPTHADTHMGAVAHPRLMESYVQIALRHGMPPMLLRLDEAGWREVGRSHAGAALDDEAILRIVGLTRELEERGVPLLDGLSGLSLAADPATRLEQATAALDALRPGLTHFIVHPARDTPELRAITGDWGCRAADLETFSRPQLARHVRDRGIRLVGYRELQLLMRAA